MDIYSGVPEDVADAANLIKALQAKPILTRAEKDKINQARLKVAYWALGSEQVAASRENLTYILGSDSKEIMSNYDKALEQEKDKDKTGDTKRKEKGKDSGFWENA